VTSATDRLIESLVRGLEPVRPLPSLRLAFAVILAVWATLLGAVLWTQGGEIGLRSLFADHVYLGSSVGLAIAALGATFSALAAGVPGRERIEIAGMGVALIGLLAAAVACWIGMDELRTVLSTSHAGVDRMCFQKGVLLSLLPGGVVLSFLVRGWALHPLRAAGVALLASGALGALIVQASCGDLDPRHLLVGHLAVPVVLALLGLYPLAVVLRRLRG
jgi:hypothetical protein